MSKPQKTPVGYSVRGVVVKAGGPQAVAAARNISEQSVRLWKTIPAKHAEVVAVMAGLPLSVVRPELTIKK
jgi:hypothetical protein